MTLTLDRAMLLHAVILLIDGRLTMVVKANKEDNLDNLMLCKLDLHPLLDILWMPTTENIKIPT